MSGYINPGDRYRVEALALGEQAWTNPYPRAKVAADIARIFNQAVRAGEAVERTIVLPNTYTRNGNESAMLHPGTIFFVIDTTPVPVEDDPIHVTPDLPASTEPSV